jgi:hypothetical protein
VPYGPYSTPRFLTTGEAVAVVADVSRVEEGPEEADEEEPPEEPLAHRSKVRVMPQSQPLVAQSS